MSTQDLTPPDSGKEPWLAVNLSSLFPGIGQIYAGRPVRGLILLISQLAIQIFGLLSLLLPEGSITIGLGLFALSLLISLGNLIDAYGCARSSNSGSFENSRKNNKDPWFAVFLSRFIPGLGFLYIRQWIIGILLFVFTLATLVVPSLSLLGHIAFPLIIFLVYRLAPIR
ncbi:MAG: hypothetical protein WA902_19860, partial [Thermosynechococcaceae cyanobacterium]